MSERLPLSKSFVTRLRERVTSLYAAVTGAPSLAPSAGDSDATLWDKFLGLVSELSLRGSSSAVSVPTIAALRALDVSNLANGTVITVAGYYTAGDGGGGEFRIDTADTATADDGGSVIATGSGARAKAIFAGTVNARRYGAKGNASNDDTAALQAAIDYAAANASTTLIPDGDYRTTAPLTLGDNSSVVGTPRTWIRPDFSGDINSYQHSVIRNKNLFSGAGLPPYNTVAALNKNISLERIKIKAMSASCNARGVLFCNVHDVYLNDVEIERTYSNWAFTFFARDVRALGLKVNDNQALFEDGIHVLGGEHMVFSGFNIRAGDDALAVGWDGTDAYCRDVTFGPGTVRSEKAFAVKIFSPPEMTSGTTKQERISYVGIVGEGGASRNGAVFLYEQGTPSGTIRDVRFSNCVFRANSGGSGHDGVNPYGIWLLGTSNVSFSGVSISGARSNQLLIQSLRGPAQFFGCRFQPLEDTSTETVAVYGSGANRASFYGCSIESPWRRSARFDESDGEIQGSSLSAAVQPHVVLYTAGVNTRSFYLRGSSLSGVSTQPVFASGPSSALLDFVVTDNRFTSGSTISGITATNYSYFGNRGSSTADQSPLLAVAGNLSSQGQLSAATLTVGSVSSGLVATFTGGSGGAAPVRLERNGQPTISFLPSIGLLVRDETNNRPLFRSAWSGSVIDWTFGSPSASTPVPVYVYGERGQGTDVPSSELWVIPGLGTGAGLTSGARVRIATPVAGPSGTAIQSVVERVRIDDNGTTIGPTLGGVGLKSVRHGRATLVAGSVTVSDANVTTLTRVMLSVRTSGGTRGFLDTSTRSTGVSFTITSSSALDTSVVDWVAFEP